jgi:hypothetical protein
MPAAPPPNTPDLNSPSQLKATFQPKLAEWRLDSIKLKMLGAVVENWLAGDQAEDIDHFRQRHRRHIGPLDDLVNRQLVTHGGAGKYYEPKFLAFCLLLADGNRTAVKLRFVMDRLFRLVKDYLDERPIRHHRSTTQVREQLPQDLRPLLIPAIKLLSEPSTGISLGGVNTPYPDLNFSDTLLRYTSPNQLAWTHLKDHRGQAGQYFVGVAPVSIPFDLTRLQIAPEVHASATKAVGSLASSPDTAVSQARAGLEATFKQILGPGHPQLEDKLPRQATTVLELLQLKGEFSELGERLLDMMKTIGAIRNKYGDVHGRAPGVEGVTRPEAQLTVGTALLLCEFLLDRWEAIRSLPKSTLVSSNKKAA